MTQTWISLHVFYASNQNRLLVDAIEPLVNALRKQGLIQRSFFIKYWQEGPHVRLRLLPAEGADEGEIRRKAEADILAYLGRRPALYHMVEDDSTASFYKDMFVWEYGEEVWSEKYGAEGKMPVHANNSLEYTIYEPEYGRYGGAEGVELAEWHFEKSSEIVFKLIRNTNLHVRTVMLGQSIQLAFLFCFAFMESSEEIIAFLKQYAAMWEGSFLRRGPDLTRNIDKTFGRMAPRLQRRADDMQRAASKGGEGTLTPLEREWLEHIRELRQRVDALSAARTLHFLSRQAGPDPFVPNDAAVARGILLGSYLHMMNNRLGVTIPDEIPLAHMMRRTLEANVRRVQEAIV